MPPKRKAHRAEDVPPGALEEALQAAKRSQYFDALRGLSLITKAPPPSVRTWTSAIATVLYSCYASQQAEVIQAASSWFRATYSETLRLPSTPAPPFDERIGTLGLRVLHRAGLEESDLLGTLRGMLHKLEASTIDGLRLTATRRLFTPVFEAALEQKSTKLALEAFDEALARGVELQDADLALALQTTAGNTDTAASTRRLIAAVSKAKPLVSAQTAELIAKSLPDAVICRDLKPLHEGQCSNCGGRFRPFSFSAVERQRILSDIAIKLVGPHCEQRIAAHPEDRSAYGAFDAFMGLTREIESLTDVPAVLDGANVGFFGLSSWYESAKRQVVEAKGKALETIAPDEFDATHLKKQGLPPDVSPNFAVIDAAVNAFKAAHENRSPVIFLHERHLAPEAFVANNNARFLESWKEHGIRVIRTPNHINDDVCWMYAAIRFACPVISNDQMRDHHFKLLAPLDFVKWRATNRIAFTAYFAGTTTKVQLFPPPKALVWMSVSDVDRDALYFPRGVHVPFTMKGLVEDKGKLDASAVSNSSVMPDSDAELMDFARRNVAGWVCAS